MSEWIDFSVYAVLLAAFWFVFAPRSAWVIPPLVADRNPEWFAAHPHPQLPGHRWFVPSCYVLGAVSIAVLLSLQVGFWPPQLSPTELKTEKWDILRSVSGGFLIAGIAYFYGGVFGVTAWMKRQIPPAERRQATLECRSIEGYIPGWFRRVIYALLGLDLMAWIAVGLLDLPATPGFWLRLCAPVFFVLFALCWIRRAIDRRPNVLDRTFGPSYRCGEVRSAFAVIVFLLGWSILRLSQEVGKVATLEVDRVLQLGLAAFIAFGLMFFSQTPRAPLAER